MADALASGASVRKDVGVQVPPSAPRKVLISKENQYFFFFPQSRNRASTAAAVFFLIFQPLLFVSDIPAHLGQAMDEVIFMSYVSPKIRSQFESLSVELKNEILSRNVHMENLHDLISVLETIVSEGEHVEKST